MEPNNTEPKEQELNSSGVKRKVPMRKTQEIIKKIPQQKPHIEFISALLTIPVLITVLLLNLNNLRVKPNASPTPTVTPSVSPSPVKQKPAQSGFTNVTTVQQTSTPQPTTDPNQCIKGIGPIDISYPQEGQTVADNPLCISISYTADNYCAVVWAYKINGGSLSDYSNNSVCLYNLPSGNNTFTLQAKSLVSNSNKTIDRHFVYQPSNQTTQQPSLTPTSTATTSALNR